MALFRRGGSFARNTIFEVSFPYSERGWKRQFVKQLGSHGVDVVIDVGANAGQYATDLRTAGYNGRIVSFEPQSGPFSLLEGNASTDPLWDCRHSALGETDGTVTINVAGNAGLSSSVLPMLKSHQDAFPPANYVGTEEVPIHRLDTVAPEVHLTHDEVIVGGRTVSLPLVSATDVAELRWRFSGSDWSDWLAPGSGYTVALPEQFGIYSIEIQVRDMAGNVSTTRSMAVTVLPPALFLPSVSAP